MQRLISPRTAFSVLLLASAAIAPGAAREAESGPMHFSDGSLATPYDHCGDADLCATVQYPNGDVLSIYSEGAAFCQPYLVHFVLVHGALTIYEFSRTLNHDPINTNGIGSHCGHSRPTQMTLDHGLVHLTVDELTDGSLHFVFSPTAFATAYPQAT